MASLTPFELPSEDLPDVSTAVDATEHYFGFFFHEDGGHILDDDVLEDQIASLRALDDALALLREVAAKLQDEIQCLLKADERIGSILQGLSKGVDKREDDSLRWLGSLPPNNANFDAGYFPPPRSVGRDVDVGFFTKSASADGSALAQTIYPEANEDVDLVGSVARGRMQWWYRHLRWTERESEHLSKLVCQEAQERRVASLCTVIKNSNLSPEEVRRERKAISEASQNELAIDAKEWTLEEWTIFAEKNKKDLNGRDGEDVRNRFLNWVAPWLCRVWIKEDDQVLCRVVSEYSGLNWQRIAENMKEKTGKERSAIQCFVRFRSTLDTEMISRGKWEPDEDSMLIELVNTIGTAWSTIADRMRWRTADQCLHRYYKVLQPQRRSGKWTKDEEDALRDAVKDVGPRWSLVATRIPGRTDVQCREKWVRGMDPDKNSASWTEGEDKMLIELVRASPCRPKWSEIARSISSGRTDTACRKRHRVLMDPSSRAPSTRPGKKRKHTA